MTDSPTAPQAVRLLVRGRVQGVGFRYYTRERARRHGLVGWVRNLPDGGVEAVAEGESASLDSFIRDVQNGPPSGHVDSCQVCREPACGHYVRFDIDY